MVRGHTIRLLCKKGAKEISIATRPRRPRNDRLWHFATCCGAHERSEFPSAYRGTAEVECQNLPRLLAGTLARFRIAPRSL